MYAECKWRLWTTQINILKTENVNRGSTGFGVLSLLYVYWLKIIQEVQMINPNRKRTNAIFDRTAKATMIGTTLKKPGL